MVGFRRKELCVWLLMLDFCDWGKSLNPESLSLLLSKQEGNTCFSPSQRKGVRALINRREPQVIGSCCAVDEHHHFHSLCGSLLATAWRHQGTASPTPRALCSVVGVA